MAGPAVLHTVGIEGLHVTGRRASLCLSRAMAGLVLCKHGLDG